MNQIHFPNPVGGLSRQSAWMNRLLKAAKARTHLTSVGNRLMESPYGTFQLTAKGTSATSPEEGATIARFRIMAVTDETLICARYEDDGTLSQSEVLTSVAKGALLRGPTPRTVTVPDTGGGTITESVQPAYTVGNDIFAAEDPEGTTGLVGITWIDINVDGRHWHPEYRVVCVRVNNVNRQMIVAGGAPFG